MTCIVFMSFGPDGGRIGRWHWRNSGAPDRLAWQQPGWGQLQWDPIWPLPWHEKNDLGRVVAAIGAAFQGFARSLVAVSTATAEAAKNAEAFRRAFRDAGRVVDSSHHHPP